MSTLTITSKRSPRLGFRFETERLDVMTGSASRDIPNSTRGGDRAACGALQAVHNLARSKDVRDTMTSVREAVSRLARVERHAVQLLLELNGVVTGGRRNLLATLASARQTMDELRILSRNLRLAPSSLIFGRDRQELAPPAPQGGK